MLGLPGGQGAWHGSASVRWHATERVGCWVADGQSAPDRAWAHLWGQEGELHHVGTELTRALVHGNPVNGAQPLGASGNHRGAQHGDTSGRMPCHPVSDRAPVAVW